MKSIVSRLIEGVRFAFLYNKAIDYSSRQENEKSFSVLKSAYALLGAEAPSTRVTYECNILLSHVASAIGKYDLAMRATKVALNQLDSSKQPLSEADADYLRYYCKTVFEYCALNTNYEDFAESRSIKGTFREIRWDEVSPRFKRTFPVTRAIASEQATSRLHS
jgi:hypothetical protein